jgi:hypothetical protein
VAVLLPLGTETGTEALASVFAAEADADGVAVPPELCTAPVELDASFPPPTWTAPVEPVALLLPPETATGASAAVVWFAVVAVVPGSSAVAPAWTTPVESLDVFVPPDCPAPVESVAVLPPPAVETGTDAVLSAEFPVVLTVGSVATAPTCATPVELVAVLPGSAIALPACPSAAALISAARPMNLRLIENTRFRSKVLPGPQLPAYRALLGRSPT